MKSFTGAKRAVRADAARAQVLPQIRR